MFSFRRFCLVLPKQRCIDSGNEEGDPHPVEVSSSDSKLGFVGKYSELEEPTTGAFLKLILTVAETTAMTLGQQFEITPKGLKASTRAHTAGKTFAGSAEAEGDVIINDILLPASERGVGRQHFVIEYSPHTRSYHLRDLSEGSGTFIRLDQPLVLSRLSVISFGESHVSFGLDGPTEAPELKVTILEGPRKDEKL